MNPAEFSVRNRALVNAAVVLVLLIGAYSYIKIPRELSPRVSFNWAFISVAYPGASPTEIEDLVSIPIEEELQAVEDVDVTITRSRRGSSLVWLKFDQIDDEEFERRLDDIRTRLNRVDFPEEAKDPLVSEFTSYDFDPVVTVVVRGSVPERTLNEVTEDLIEDLHDIPGVDEITASGYRKRAAIVECDPYKLEAHQLDITDVETALSLANLNLPGGEIRVGGEEYLVRTQAQFTGAEDIANITLRAGGDGRRIRLSDVATVIDDFEDRAIISRFNGEPAISLSFTKQESGNTIDIVDGARAVVADWQTRLPTGVSLDITADQSVLISDILGVLESNALLGLFLVVGALFMFMGWRGATVAALGIPVTFLLAFIAMSWSEQSLNGNTLFGLILVLGMVVDDAVVVLENAFRHLEKGKKPSVAVVDGVKQVVSPVIISSLTTMGGFLPLILMPGTTGKFMRIVPIVVSLVLLASLIESLLIMPSHFVDIVRKAPKRRHEPGSRWWEKLYLSALRKSLRWRYAIVAMAVVLLIGAGMLIPMIGIDMFGGDEISSFYVYVTMPDGTNLEETDQLMRQFERQALALPESELDGVTLATGLMQTAGEWVRSPHVGQLVVDIVEPDQRERELDEIIDDLRQRTAGIPGPIKLEFFKKTGGPPAESPVELLVKGPDLETLTAVAERLKDELRSLDGLQDVRDDLSLTQRELNVVVDREAAARRQLDPTRIARAVRAGFGGSTATTFREADDELDVIVRYPREFRNSLANVTSMRFINPMGQAVPFTEVARLEEGMGPVTIRRHDRERQVTVRANIDKEVTDIGAVNRHMFAFFDEVRGAYPGAKLETGGQFKEFMESFNNLLILFGFGILLNFILMVGQFKNWLQPFLILAVVPLSFIGAMVGLLMTGKPFSISTLYGFVALAGVAVNDSLVLVDFINQARRKGFSNLESLFEAGRVRLRPIMLTSVTTILGLLPMALGLGGTSTSWQPLATTIAAGLAVATVISLLLIPCLQLILDDMSGLLQRVSRRRQSPRPSGEPVLVGES